MRFEHPAQPVGLQEVGQRAKGIGGQAPNADRGAIAGVTNVLAPAGSAFTTRQGLQNGA